MAEWIQNLLGFQIKGELPKWPLPPTHCRLAVWEEPERGPRGLHSTRLPRLIVTQGLARMRCIHSQSLPSMGLLCIPVLGIGLTQIGAQRFVESSKDGMRGGPCFF